jgi:hypothetical protein
LATRGHRKAPRDFLSTRDFMRKLSKHGAELAALRTGAAAG